MRLIYEEKENILNDKVQVELSIKELVNLCLAIGDSSITSLENAKDRTEELNKFSYDELGINSQETVNFQLYSELKNVILPKFIHTFKEDS